MILSRCSIVFTGKRVTKDHFVALPSHSPMTQTIFKLRSLRFSSERHALRLDGAKVVSLKRMAVPN